MFSDFIDFDLSYFINFHPYFNSYISFRKEYFSFKPYFYLIADNQGIIHFTYHYLSTTHYFAKKNLLQNNQLRHFRYT